MLLEGVIGNMLNHSVTNDHESERDFLFIIILTPYSLNELIRSLYIKRFVSSVHCSPQEGDGRGEEAGFGPVGAD